MAVIEIRQTTTYTAWSAALKDRQAKARIDIRIRRLSLGNAGDVKPVGEGVSELRIDSALATVCTSCRREAHSSSCSPVATSRRRSETSETRKALARDL